MGVQPQSPPRGSARLDALRTVALDRDHKAAFDRLARIAAAYLEAPIVRVSIVEEDRQVFAGSCGPDATPEAVRETPIDQSYCRFVVERGEPLVISDTDTDPLVRENPGLLESDTRAYLGVPIITSDGHTLGAFCAVDTEPRTWTSAQIAFLTDLTASVVTEIELRQELVERQRVEAAQARSEAHYRRLATGIPQGVYVLDVDGRFTELNDSAQHILQLRDQELLGQSFASIISSRSIDKVRGVFDRVLSGAADDVTFEAWVRRRTGEERLLVITATAIAEDGRITGVHGIARDVTGEREAQRALRESEERFRQIAANVRELFWIFTPDFSTAIYMSPAYEQVFGWPVEDVYADAKSFLNHVHPDDVAALMGAMEQVAHERVMGIEYRIFHSDGSMRWMLARGYPVRNDDGTVVRVVGTVEDITDRKAAEFALRESERQLRQVMDSLPMGAVLVEMPGRIAWHNPAADRIMGGVQPAGPESYRHYRGFDTETGREIDATEWPLARALAGEEVNGELIDVQTFDGRRCTTIHSAVPLRNAAGEITSAIGVFEDVTDARERDAQQRLLAAALEGLSEGIMLVTPDGEIVYANETLTTMLGIDPARVPGVRFADFAETEDIEREQQDRLRMALEHGRWSGRVRRPRLSDGVEVTIDMVLGRVEHEGTPRLLFGIAQDATAEIEREQHLRRAERLASLGTMIGGVAHELNNPLQAILNFAQLLLMDERSPEDRDSIAVMVREAQRMARIVADLKQIARSTQDEAPQKTATDLNEVVQHVMKVQAYRMRTSNIQVRQDLGTDVPAILVDRAQLEQVIVNLVVNAEQAMAANDGSARLILRTRASALGASLHVVDNGHGIPPHQLERIFDPFFTTKAPGEGTGLGLSLVHSIVTEHGGEIRVDSEIGTGTAFRLDWCRAIDYDDAVTRQHPETSTGAVSGPHKLRVLVVDDEPAVRGVMARYLGRRGHTVDQAVDGAAALAMLDDAAYDVILSDLRMPGLGGEALMDRLIERGLADRVIFMTGDAAGAAVRLAEAGVPVLLKPIDLSAVAEAVESRRGRSVRSST